MTATNSNSRTNSDPPSSGALPTISYPHGKSPREITGPRHRTKAANERRVVRHRMLLQKFNTLG
jgi:hypothetical protein